MIYRYKNLLKQQIFFALKPLKVMLEASSYFYTDYMRRY
jgi:hypothetical protein